MKNNNELAFWNREGELEELSRWYAQKPILGVMHGRRRLGKTTLLRRWLRKTPGCYIQATEGTPASQRAALAEDPLDQLWQERVGPMKSPDFQPLTEIFRLD